MNRNIVITKTITNTSLFRTLLNFWRAGLLAGGVILFNMVFNRVFNRVFFQQDCRQGLKTRSTQKLSANTKKPYLLTASWEGREEEETADLLKEAIHRRKKAKMNKLKLNYFSKD